MIKKMQLSDLEGLLDLAMELWPDNRRERLAVMYTRLLQAEDAAIFGLMENGRWDAFAQCQLRRDYVEGCTTSPVGYLEGVHVRERMQGQGVARALLNRCQAWAKAQGCSEFASDCELGNVDSYRFHMATGFLEAGRIICFVKPL